MCSGVKRNDDDDRIKGDLFWHCYGFGNLATYVHDSDCTPPPKNLVAISFCSFSKNRVKGNCLQKCMEVNTKYSKNNKFNKD